jgi:mono/diheme cytochrome c family protein
VNKKGGFHMKRIAIVLCVAAVCIALLSFGGFGQASAKSKIGEEEFKKNCSSCHPKGGNVIEPEDTIKGSPKLRDFKTFLSWIRKPVQPMPTFSASQISEEQARQLYDYIVEASKSEWK